MLFYPTRRGSAPVSSSHQAATGETGEAIHLSWMLRSFVMGITLLGFSYWLMQIAGAQYLATTTTGALLAFLFAYVVWYWAHRSRHYRQVQNSYTSVSSESSY
jgi:sterol desaturase/sphingolipid hydroxylase (fatty acid hydroxylase superfamily)